MLYSTAEWLADLLLSLFRILWEVLLLALLLSVPAANFFAWKSNLKPNLKLIYVSVFSLLLLGIMMIMELRRDEVIDNLANKFDPSLTFYDRDLIKTAKVSVDHPVSEEMGLDTCIDPEGNLVDLKKRLKYDNTWVLLEIPSEFMRKESVSTILQRGDFRSGALESSAQKVNLDRLNQIKLEDFRFLDLYLKKERLRYAKFNNDRVLFFDLDGATEETFERYIRSVEDYQKSLLRDTSILFTTSDNYMTNKMKGSLA